MKKVLLLPLLLSPFFASALSTGFMSPTATAAPSGGWTDPANAFASDDTYTTVPHGSGCRCPFLYLSWDNGASYTSANIVGPFGTTDNTLTAGSSSDLWGHTWVESELTNANFRLKIANPSTLIEQGYCDFNFFIPAGSVITGIEVRVEQHGDAGFTTEYIDVIQVNVHYTNPTPTCDDPTGLAASGVTNTDANIDWDAVSGITGFEYELNTTATPPTGAGTPTTANAYNTTSLTGGTVYYFHLRVDCGSGIYSDWVTISFNTTTLSVNEIAQEQMAEVYPNPSSGMVNIKTLGAYREGQLTITDMTGKLLANVPVTNGNTVVDMTTYAPQVYYFIYTSGDSRQTYKVVRQ